MMKIVKDGFIKVASASVDMIVADTKANSTAIKECINRADINGVNLLVLPELCVTGYTCGDLFYSDTLIQNAMTALIEICDYTQDKYPIAVLGLPVKFNYKLYNCAAVIHKGEILALVPKTFLPNYSEYYEKRQFASADDLGPEYKSVSVGGEPVPFGKQFIFRSSELDAYRFGLELCEDLWVTDPPSRKLCESGAVIIANPSASDETIGKEGYRRLLVSSTSARLMCGYIYTNASPSESTQDMVFSRHNIICENGTVLAENKPFGKEAFIITEIDVNRLASERHKMTGYISKMHENYSDILFDQQIQITGLTRTIEKNPFVPPADSQIRERAETILRIQSYGLKKRIEHTHVNTVVIGISGGLDSCLALLVIVRTMDLLHRGHKDIIAVTMPCFGTTRRTKNNAQKMCEYLGVTFKEINITAAVRQHFKDIGHDENIRDVTYENCQARERTQVLMDIANKENGLVVGTGDLSELALGWATYNGDHMSMYGVNTSVPKTLVRYIVRYEAENFNAELCAVILDILDTPVSPELLPAGINDNILQKTEDLVGPYELHDFYLYYMIRFGFTPGKIFRLAKAAFNGNYTDEMIIKWLKIFIKRFFTQQFKRSCLPDGPKVGSATLSPRGDWRMPSDASYNLWMLEAEKL